MHIWNVVLRGEDVTPFVSYQHRDLGMVREFVTNIER